AAALALGAGANHPGIRPAAGGGLGHREGGAHLSRHDGTEPFFSLSRRSGTREQIHVAVVRRRAVERERAEDRAVGFLVHHRPAPPRRRPAAPCRHILLAPAVPTAPLPWLCPAGRA